MREKPVALALANLTRAKKYHTELPSSTARATITIAFSTLRKLALLLFALVLGSCGRPSSGVLNAEDEKNYRLAVEIGSQVSAKCVLSDSSLGMLSLFIDENPCSIELELSNKSNTDLIIGSDMLACADGDRGFSGLVVRRQKEDGNGDRLLAYAYSARMITGLTGDKIHHITLGPSGQMMSLDESISKGYSGVWDVALPAGGKAKFHQAFMAKLGGNSGWVASPSLSVAAGPSFRLLVEFGAEPSSPIILPLTASHLVAFIKDATKPEVLRNWAIVWLASLPGEGKWQHAGALLEDVGQTDKIRKAFGRSLATQAPPDALETVNNVLWAKDTSEELQLLCYYAFTWSPHEEQALGFIQKAISHPNPKVKAAAQEFSQKH